MKLLTIYQLTINVYACDIPCSLNAIGNMRRSTVACSDGIQNSLYLGSVLPPPERLVRSRPCPQTVCTSPCVFCPRHHEPP
ncbi:hypothetical protein V1527DRAFT_473151 [Lipomyces starkeyi]